MEDLIGALLGGLVELFVEFLLEFGVELLFQAAANKVRGKVQTDGALQPILNGILLMLAGALAGFFSFILFPHPLVPPSKLHGVSILLSPTLTGLAMMGLGRVLQKYGRTPGWFAKFGYGFSFAFGMALARFLLVG